jgi:intracellular sulfur oxidation DsrE/DsrF family protein
MVIMSLAPTEEDAMLQRYYRLSIMLSVLSLFAIAGLLMSPATLLAEQPSGKGKMKVLYHVDGKDPDVAKYALALIHKHIEAEGGPQNIDIKLVIHGPALALFEKDKIDPELKKKFDVILEDGAHAEMCQVSMKIFGKSLEDLVPGLESTLHPVAVKRIADLQAQGYLYIKP